MDEEIAQDLGARFVLRNPVGSGGMATVYRALERHTGDTVAVKLLHAGDPSHLARFALEVGALASLDHPAVVRLLAHGKWPDGWPSLAMEWLEGEDLATRLGRGPLPPREVVTLCLWVAEALAAAHARGIIQLDDLHWGDKPSIDLLDATLGELRGRPVLVLALARPEVHDTFPRLWAKRSMLEIRMGGLPPAAASMLVRQMLGDSLDAALTARMIERAEGNAFYLEEMIRAVADGRSDALPDTVLAMVQARLDVLSAQERAVLRAASVLGETFWQRGVEALLDGSPHQAQVSTCLKTILSKEILIASRSSRFAGEKELAFRHALLRDGAYALWAEPDRRAAHLRPRSGFCARRAPSAVRADF